MSTNPGHTHAAHTERPVAAPHAAPATAEATRAQAEFVRCLNGTGAHYVVTSPGRLDVMGGLTEYTGGLVLHWPVDISVRCGACRRDDGRVVFHMESAGTGHAVTMRLEELRETAAGAVLTTMTEDRRMIIAHATVVELLRHRWLGDAFAGASVVLGRIPPIGADVGQVSALAASVLVALQRVAGVTLSVPQAASVIERVEQSVDGLPCGRGDAVHALVAEPGGLTQLRCDHERGADVLRLSERCALVGISCGGPTEGRLRRYMHARVAAEMGRVLIDRICQHESRDADAWSGHLSLVSGRDYSGRYRDRLPTRLQGADFLRHFGPLPNPITQVEPKVVYRVRSRTEHHVYENARTIQFAERLARAARTGDDTIAAEAGALMYASNWSLSQRCGLSAAHADGLVTLLRRRGTGSGILGAKQGGRGCGSLVIALIANTRAARAAVDAACAEFESKTGRATTQYTATAPGAVLGGVSCLR